MCHRYHGKIHTKCTTIRHAKDNSPKRIAEASNDKLWGTGIKLRDQNALKVTSLEGPDWLSEILTNGITHS